MNQEINEILTYSIFKQENALNIHIPVSGLVRPSFLIKNNDLYIFLNEFEKAFILKNIENLIMDYIVLEQAYIVETLIYDKNIKHKILLNN